MSTFFLKKDGLIFEYLEEGQLKIIEDENYIISNLDFDIELDKDYTLRSYFEMIIKYPVLAILDSFLPQFIKEYKKCPKENCLPIEMNLEDENYQKIKHLSLTQCVEYTVDENDLDISYDFGGIGDYKIGYGDSPDELCVNGGISISLSKLYRILDIHITIEGSINIRKIDKDHPVKNITWDPHFLKQLNLDPYEIKNYIEDYSQNLKTRICLFLFVKQIIWELSFYGNPEERDVTFNEITERVDSAKNEFNNP